MVSIPPKTTNTDFVPASPMSQKLSRVLNHKSITIGGGILIVMILMAILAPFIAPHDPFSQNLTKRFLDPVWYPKGTWEHPLGTDSFGRDYLSRMIFGARASLLIGFSAMLISGLIGTTLGVLAGYFGGRVDMVITFIITTRLAIPVILVALVVVALAGNSLSIVIWVLGFLIWDRFAVVMRSATQQIRALDYVTAAQAIGCSTLRIIFSEILPNITNALIVIATLEVAHAILLEAALSFLGLGVQPPTPSWGLMVSEGKGMMFFKAWVIAIPGIALFLLVLSINLLGDGIRDVTAPENRN
ncbi:MAG: peptide ABC transporter permease [Gammaproteobacteria bacterium CG12_big_fil_rev_8_21_14_0_65_46_12]|nr:MAG: peptide ABC transporter permease [Gammaproteobacteria bacterium CG12_big_fil_rev_8_21_14_0_65_46_12]